MNTHILTNDGKQDLKFKGSCIASVTSDHSSTNCGYEEELAIYVSLGNKIICQQIKKSLHLDAPDQSNLDVYDELGEIKTFFGHSLLAKRLYNEIGINDQLEIN